ncbi:Cof-type HAD-IIB family hydrolase [Microbacterium sp. SS28]|uniref:Cof-type HAD-IIB family hydrolase n=1 Tax=Microbacterium sp. SS28 TaxID=2919948 RepID=UPI001FA987E2|nr:Cof-type HAD-IIB family hydrolase [Microbacterium sp. SS28]
MTQRRIVFLDVDGTLVGHDQQVSPAVAQALSTARDRGNLLFLCTGRSRAEIPTLVTDLGFDGVVSAGGGFIEMDGELLARRTMPPEAVDELEALFGSFGIEYAMQAYEAVYPSAGLLTRLVPVFARLGIHLEDDEGEGARMAQEFTRRGPVPREGIAKASFFGEHETTFAHVRDALGDRFHVITGTIPYLGEAGGEVTLAGINKGSAIVQLIDQLGLRLEDTIGIGDSVNDLEMLDVVGVGIAMGNADGTVKARADEITASVTDDGVAVAFRSHGLA